VVTPRAVRALGFCVSVEHAEFMAARFTAAGVPALALHGDSPAETRQDAPRRLRDREINVIFTCDLYNEGVDLPFVDTLMLLRPTQSATLFLQQLGRGLRHHAGKPSCLVLDFIGQQHERFRFDAVLAAFTGVPRAQLRRAVENGFPFLPSGCTLQLDAVARGHVLDSLRTSLAGARRLAAELRDLAATKPAPTLATFLEATGRELDDVYAAGHGWATVRKLAGLAPDTDEETENLSHRLRLLTHIDEPTRLRSYQRTLDAARAGGASRLSDAELLRWNMLDFQLDHRGTLRAAEDTVQYFASRPAITAELDELRAVLEERIALPHDEYPVPEWPLALHRHYEQREILAAVSFGPVSYLTHAGDRPIAITWRLAHPMPAALFERYATLASG
jgi:hypothetical protein